MKKCIVLVSRQSFSAEHKSNSASLEAIFNAKKIKREEVDGSAEENTQLRNDLFSISGIRGTYPQVFFQVEGSNTPQFVGLFDAIQKKTKKRKAESDGRPATGDDDDDFQLVKLQGTGRILTSGTTVMGKMGTKFYHELSIGDALIIMHPTSMKEETRIVKMVLSDVSISISSDLVSTTTFSYIKAPPEEIDQDAIETKKRSKKNEEETFAFGTYAGGTSAGSEFTYRVKKAGAYGGYAVLKEVTHPSIPPFIHPSLSLRRG
ncbi:hypothetical protein B5M09_007000 [Aphanomyces astaci]|uniref:Uncharacterized protein n=1 Tax=Aphanomyces astaci TaxID=112090 RepID=A0A3R7X3A9_APHAT|nr:hypothetical protein B5M09_007000 [Aphanomyces astaci]